LELFISSSSSYEEEEVPKVFDFYGGVE